jgi:hypothetical protein
VQSFSWAYSNWVLSDSYHLPLYCRPL